MTRIILAVLLAAACSAPTAPEGRPSQQKSPPACTTPACPPKGVEPPPVDSIPTSIIF